MATEAKLVDNSCSAFSEALASKSSVPGGGGAAALAGALGISLGMMAGNFTSGKKKYADVEDKIQELLTEGERIRRRLLRLVDEDAKAFEPLSKAYAIPKDDPMRESVLEAATLAAIEPPFKMVKYCGEAIDVLQKMLAVGSKMLISDIGCGATLAKAAMDSAALNVFVNTRSLIDRDKSRSIESEVDGMLIIYKAKADLIISEVNTYIRKK